MSVNINNRNHKKKNWRKQHWNATKKDTLRMHKGVKHKAWRVRTSKETLPAVRLHLPDYWWPQVSSKC